MKWIVKFREHSMTGRDMPIMYREVEGRKEQCEAGARQTAEPNDWCYLGIIPSSEKAHLPEYAQFV